MDTKRPKALPSRFEPAYARKLRNNARANALLPKEMPDDPKLRMRIGGRHASIVVGNARRNWRGCPVTRCRRARACFAPFTRCSNERPDPGYEAYLADRELKEWKLAVQARIAQEEAKWEQAEIERRNKAIQRAAARARLRAPKQWQS